MSKVWIVSLQEGSNNTWALVDELPIVMEVEESELEDPMWQPPFPCDDTDHIHIKALIENSHWNDACEQYFKEAWEEHRNTYHSPESITGCFPLRCLSDIMDNIKTG